MKTININDNDYDAADVADLVSRYLEPVPKIKIGTIVKSRAYGNLVGMVSAVNKGEFRVICFSGNRMTNEVYNLEQLNEAEFSNSYEFVANNLEEYFKNKSK